jgi:hypothetical protein
LAAWAAAAHTASYAGGKNPCGGRPKTHHLSNVYSKIGQKRAKFCENM